MDVGLANILFSWLLHIDLACIVCNWDPATQSWIPFGAAGAAAGAFSFGGGGGNRQFPDPGFGGDSGESSPAPFFTLVRR